MHPNEWTDTPENNEINTIPPSPHIMAYSGTSL